MSEDNKTKRLPRLKDLTPEQQEVLRKQWHEKYLRERDKKKLQYDNMDPKLKHEKSEATRRKRYVKKNGSLDGFVPRIYGEAKVYKTPGYEIYKPYIKGVYKTYTEEEKEKKRESTRRNEYKLKHGSLEGYVPKNSSKSGK